MRNFRHNAEGLLAYRRWRSGHSSLVALAGQHEVQRTQLAPLVWRQCSLPTLGHHRRSLCVSIYCVNLNIYVALARNLVEAFYGSITGLDFSLNKVHYNLLLLTGIRY